MTGKLKQEIQQNKPFTSLQEEVVLSLERTAGLVTQPIADVLKASSLSTSQYNVLRILRGSGEGLPCGEISLRMVRRDPDLTRLLDRLDARGLVTRTRDTRDRRVVLAAITPEGIALLDEIDAPMHDALQRVLAHVPEKKLRALLELLEDVRG
jgi:DNA-binding MarR family transcriptional regulator